MNCKGVGCNGLSSEGVRPKGVTVGNPFVAVTSPPIGVLVASALGIPRALLGLAVPHSTKPTQ